jgi:hypothetical protein
VTLDADEQAEGHSYSNPRGTMTELPPRPAHRRLKGIAAYRPYWRGYDQEEDEELAKELFFGRSIVDAAGRSKNEYPAKTVRGND